jgi:hypothetical protein
MSKKSKLGSKELVALLQRNHEAISIPYERELSEIHTRCHQSDFGELHKSLKDFFADKHLLLNNSHQHLAGVCEDLKVVDKAHTAKLRAEHLLDFLTDADGLDAFSEVLEEHLGQQDPRVRAKLLKKLESTLHKVHGLVTLLHHSEIHRERGSPVVSEGLQQRHADCHSKIQNLKLRVRAEIERTHSENPEVLPQALVFAR